MTTPQHHYHSLSQSGWEERRKIKQSPARLTWKPPSPSPASRDFFLAGPAYQWKQLGGWRNLLRARICLLQGWRNRAVLQSLAALGPSERGDYILVITWGAWLGYKNNIYSRPGLGLIFLYNWHQTMCSLYNSCGQRIFLVLFTRKNVRFSYSNSNIYISL